MLITRKNFIVKKDKNLIIEEKSGEIKIENKSSSPKLIILKKIFFDNKNANCEIEFKGKNIYGYEPQLKFINRKAKVTVSLNFGEKHYFAKPNKMFMTCIKVMPNSCNIIKKINIELLKDYENEIYNSFKEDILLVCPGYPSNDNKYLFSFVHTRVREYKNEKININVVSLSDSNIFTYYDYESIKVWKLNYDALRNLLLIKKFKKIIVHFFTDEIAQILDAVDTTKSDILIFTHGTDTIYRDYNILNNKYFTPLEPITNDLENYFQKKDKTIKRYNNMKNVKFIFASEWAKKRSEEQNNILYNNYEVIPTYINDNIFDYKEKDSELRKRVVIIRKFDNISTYSIDTDVRVILELSKKEFFKELEFNIYGDGYFYEELTKPLLKFPNVKLHRKFLSHNEISEIHKDNGIALFATRYETLGVSAAEAAMSGLVVASTDIAAVPEFFDKSMGTLAPLDDYKKLAEIIENIYKSPELFKNLSKKMSKSIKEKCNYNKTIKKEIELINAKNAVQELKLKNQIKNPILTIAIASYNVEKYLVNSVMSLLNCNLAHKLEILIVNDGSKDNTAKIGKYLEKLSNGIVKLIDKENGGHGSAINKGIELATGKYFKLMDGDDYFDTEELEKLIEKLESETSDIVLNNYVEDLSKECNFNIIKHYEFMYPGVQYELEDLCYEHYGFGEWGPLLSTSTFKTKMLQEANFKITEKCFYVDMELNSIAFSKAKTITYYPFNIYMYYIGRAGQSISADSFKKNYKNHEHVTIRIIKDIYNKFELSENKKNYLKEKIIIPLVKAQYYITTEYFNVKEPFMDFDNRLKDFPEFYNNNNIIERRIKIYRFTKGRFMKTIKSLIFIKHKLFSVFVKKESK